MALLNPDQKRFLHHVFYLNFFLVFLLFSAEPGISGEGKRFSFHISFAREGHTQPITGRVYVILSRKNAREPRFQAGFVGVPIWGKFVYELQPEEAAIIDEKTFGYPLESICDIPAGEYYVQGFVNIYTEFHRSDGHTLWLHNDQWEGQRWNLSPGNLYSQVKKVYIDPESAKPISIRCTEVIPPVKIPPDTKWVKRIKFKSKILSDFWGRPIYLGATVLLPKGYETHPEVYYPVNYHQGHFSLRPPHGFRTEKPDSNDRRGRRGYEFYQFWVSDSCPRMIAVTFQHPCPYYDDSYAVNSPNVGPYGDAIMKELIPAVEEKFRIIRKPYARVLSGGSTGGWESLALQLFHPDFFGGTWSGCPDPIDFRRFQLQNIYEDENMYYRVYDWVKVDIPETRSTDGDVLFAMKNRLYFEQVIGDRCRSGLQWAIWQAVFTPIADDGYPKPLWDWRTGRIDPQVAEKWKKYDLALYLKENWSWLGPKLAGKLHLFAGDMDNAYLNLGVVLLEKYLESTTDPYYAGEVEYGNGKGHCWMPRGADLFKRFAAHIRKYAPPGEDISSWRY